MQTFAATANKMLAFENADLRCSFNLNRSSSGFLESKIMRPNFIFANKIVVGDLAV